jgi:hypothetical protein
MNFATTNAVPISVFAQHQTNKVVSTIARVVGRTVRLIKVVGMRFGGLAIDETAARLEISPLNEPLNHTPPH